MSSGKYRVISFICIFLFVAVHRQFDIRSFRWRIFPATAHKTLLENAGLPEAIIINNLHFFCTFFLAKLGSSVVRSSISSSTYWFS
jgi:hypothetical protein